MKMRMKGGENEMTMKMRWKLLNRNTRRGTQKRKRRNQEKTPTPTHLARSGRTLKRQGKRKSGGRRKQTKTRRGGGGRKRLNQPKPQRKQGLPEHARTKTYLERGSTHEIRDQWGPSWWQTATKNSGIQSLPKKVERCSHYRTVVDQPKLGMNSYQVNVHDLLTSPKKTKRKEEPHLKVCPVALLHEVSDSGLSLEQRWKKGSFHGLQLQRSRKKVEARYSGQQFNQERHDRVKPERRLIVSLYLNELPGWKL